MTDHPARELRVAAGKAARAHAPLRSHRELAPSADRDPIGLLLEQAASRVPELVPVRHGRMLLSPFTFFRGAALPMADDLAGTATSGLRVQLCGDAHLSNFGAFASPERRLVFDLNDFDETLPGPFEWDVKRLAASVVLAGRENGHRRRDQRANAISAVSSYRQAMREFARQPILTVWYARLDVEQTVGRLQSQMNKTTAKQSRAVLAKARTRDSTQALSKLTRLVAGERQIISNPPLIVPVEEVLAAAQAEGLYERLGRLVAGYAQTLSPHHRHLLERFQLVKLARKVVGVGSVGTQAWILLLEPDDGTDPLLLQAKQAQPSVLARFVGPSEFDNQGERVVVGQRLAQAASDIFLGWQRTAELDRSPTDYYVRQLRDWKYSAALDRLNPAGLGLYAGVCGWTLARAHARTGDRIAIASYLGQSAKFDEAIADFAEAYADQSEDDHAALAAAVAAGRVQARMDL